MINHLQTLALNTDNDGEIYFVTDVHGHKTFLIKALKEIGFKFPELSNPSKISDKLILLGDLVDRGGEGYELLQTVRYNPSMFSIRGNHEKIAFDGITRTRSYYAHWLVNGGEWNESHDEFMLHDALNWANSLPDAMEVIINNKVRLGLTHAGLPANHSWDSFKKLIGSVDDMSIKEKKKLHNSILWERDSRDGNINHVIGIDAMLHGHTVHGGDVKVEGNRVYFDTGCGFSSTSEEEMGLTLLHFKEGGNILGLFEAYKFTKDPWTCELIMTKL
ncbi:metallophosphoesterase [Vibrio crassostreae]|uniref:metallophosphoesterase n=1 Tax=Vibrio crassostreae TaxID=246167 RepID=UPI001B305F9E|nr:metallophosphoesterase [Vibrio crassostreae]